MSADQEILKILSLMSDLEFRVSELYAECARQYAENRQFWSDLSQAELGHEEALKKMASLYAEKPEEYRVARPFTAVSINTAIKWAKDRLEQLRSCPLPEEKMLFVARDLEASLLESKFTEYLATGNIEYNNFAASLKKDTQDHQRALTEKINFSRK